MCKCDDITKPFVLIYERRLETQHRKEVKSMTEQEFTRLFGMYRRLVYHVAYCNIGDAAEAEDISQEVFLKLYTRPPAYDEDVQVKSWLIRVTVNRCRDVRRSLWFRLTDHTEDEPVIQPPSDTNELLEAVMSLSPKLRCVMYMYYYEDYPVKEIATLLGIKETAVTSRLMRGRAELKKLIEKEELL